MKVLQELQTIKDLLAKQVLSNKAILSIEEAAAHTTIPLKTLYEYTSKALVPHSKRGRRIFFDRVKLEQWLISDSVKTEAEKEQQASSYILRNRKY